MPAPSKSFSILLSTQQFGQLEFGGGENTEDWRNEERGWTRREEEEKETAKAESESISSAPGIRIVLYRAAKLEDLLSRSISFIQIDIIT